MWLFNRRNLLLGALALGACGFTPVYQDNANLRGAFEFSAPASRQGFVLTKQLEDRIGRANGPRFIVTLTPAISQSGAAITPDNVTTRFTVSGKIKYKITPIGSQTAVHSDSVSSVTSYSATSTTIATTTAKNAAEDRLMVLLADQIVTQIYAVAPTLP